ncbi:MAG: hypothetical protein L6R30_03915 [Thermoanaerobaculia bacterium]|nr:hypothetical protein [Thermoanaerobaculia bacterium]
MLPTFIWMRTTLELDDALYAEAKKAALEAGRPVTGLIEDALREALARRRSRGLVPLLRLPVLKGRRLRPGVDLDDSAALLDLLDEPDAARGRKRPALRLLAGCGGPRILSADSQVAACPGRSC